MEEERGKGERDRELEEREGDAWHCSTKTERTTTSEDRAEGQRSMSARRKEEGGGGREGCWK